MKSSAEAQFQGGLYLCTRPLKGERVSLGEIIFTENTPIPGLLSIENSMGSKIIICSEVFKECFTKCEG